MAFFINKKLITGLGLWLMLFLGYNTYPQKLDFSNFLKFFHGIRAFFPILAGFLALILLLRKRPSVLKILKTPLGLLTFYVLIGFISSIFLSLKPFLALYWAFSYFSVLLVLFLFLTDSELSFSSLFNLNSFVVFVLTIGLFGLFLSQPGAFQVLVNGSFLRGRPYESLANVSAGKEMLEMVGTRPTGLGRYAGVAALIALAKLLSDKRKLKLNWFFFFILFYFILVFSQAKAALLGFVLGSFLVFLFTSQSKFAVFKWSLFTLLHSALIAVLLFYLPLFYIPHLEKMAASGPTESVGSVSKRVALVSKPTVSVSEPNLKEETISFFTLSGRTVTIWPKDFKFFLKSPLIGWGFYGDRIFPEAGHAHNAILHALIQTGIIGTIFFGLAFVWAWIVLFRFFKKPFIIKEENSLLIETAGILAFFTIRGITESSGAFFGTDWLILAPLLAYIAALNQKKENVKKG